MTGGVAVICGSPTADYRKQTNPICQYASGTPILSAFYQRQHKVNNVNHETMDHLHERMRRICKQLRKAGYSMVEEWKCEFLKSETYKKTQPVQMDEKIHLVIQGNFSSMSNTTLYGLVS